MNAMLFAVALVPFAQVMVLGTYHFANPGRDAVKTRLRVTMSATRQEEIAELVKRLSAFRPTKIAVESQPQNAAKLNGNLAAYRAKTYELGANEIEQVGFRLAAQGQIDTLLLIDNRLDLDFNRLMGFMQSKEPDRAQKFGMQIQQIGAKFENWDSRFSVSALLAIHNNPTFIKQSHQFYVSLCDTTDGTDYPGADILGDWYKRNARIYGNLRKGIVKGDRVLVIYGSGHAKILRELIQDSGDLELVEASKYLPPCPVQGKELSLSN